jgi:hypothetical protein
MLLNNILLGLHPSFFAAITITTSNDFQDYDCAFSGICSSRGDAVVRSFHDAVDSLVEYFFTDPDGLYGYIFGACAVIAGIGALWFVGPLILESSKENFAFYGANLSKILLLFLLMLMFAGKGDLGKIVAYGNYAFIQSIHEGVYDRLHGRTSILYDLNSRFSADEQQVVKIVSQMLTCAELQPKKTNTNTDQATVDNNIYTNCISDLKRTLSYTFNNPTTNSLFAKAADDLASDPVKFTEAATQIKNAASGIIDVTIDEKNSQSNTGIKNLLVGWRAALAIAPDLALIGALLFYPFPLAFAFFSTSYLTTWFSGIWAVGMFKVIMTIFTSTFIIIQVNLAGLMPQDTINLLLGIAAPTIAISLATFTGLGLSNLVSQGTYALSSKLTPGSSGQDLNNINNSQTKKTNG